MCLQTKNPKIRTAKRDIYVFKKMYAVENNSCKAYTNSHLYEVGKSQPIVTLYPRDFGGKWYSVDFGYHSRNFPFKDGNTLFMIPKGAKYIEGWQNSDPIRNRVSENLVYIGPMKYGWLSRFLIKIGIKNK